MTKHFLAARLLLGFGTLSPAIALAQPAPSMAETLFHDGKRLMAEKRYSDACPKLAESQRLDPGGGTLLTLALCHEAEGKTASAWAEFNEALSAAERDKRQDRARIARARILALEPRLSRLTIRLNDAVRDLPGLEILQDGVVLGPAAWDVAAPVDPGVHRIEVRAHGRREWSESVEVTADAQSLSVEIPALEDAPPEPAPVPEPKAIEKPVRRAPPPRKDPLETRDDFRTAGWVALGVGAVGSGIGTFFALRAFSQSEDANQRCPESSCNDAEAVRLNESAGRSADTATVSFVVAGAAFAFAAYALFVHEPAPAPKKAGAGTFAIRW